MNEQTVTQYGVTRPMTPVERMAEKLRAVPKINVTTGRPLPLGQQPDVVVPIGGRPEPSIGATIARVATEMGADPVALVESEAFVASVVDLDPADDAGVAEAIAAATPARMKPNPAQGRSGIVPTGPQTMAEKLQQSIANSTTSGGRFTDLV